ncbi:MAG: hypothetical protein AVDCRST_MAG30-2067, partial [uncultured Solirubrobacteraceae bacterium]
ARSVPGRRLPLRGRPLRALRAGGRRRPLPLHPLPAPDGHGLLRPGPDRRPDVPPGAGRGAPPGVAPPRRRLREVLLRRVRRPPVQPQPRRPRPDGDPAGGLRRRSGRPAELAHLRRLRAAVGSRPGRRPRALRRGQAVL